MPAFAHETRDYKRPLLDANLSIPLPVSRKWPGNALIHEWPATQLAQKLLRRAPFGRSGEWISVFVPTLVVLEAVFSAARFSAASINAARFCWRLVAFLNDALVVG